MTSCLICGLAIFRFAHQGPEDGWEARLASRTGWWSDIRLLCDPDDELGRLVPSLQYDHILEPCIPSRREARVQGFRPRCQASDVEVHRGRYHSIAQYKLITPDGTTRNISSYCPKEPSFTTLERRQYLPVHAACLRLAEKVILTAPRDAYITDLRSLCLVLGWRVGIKLKCEGASKEFPPNYIIGRSHFNIQWENWRPHMLVSSFNPIHAWPGSHERPHDNLPDLFGSYPLFIPQLTNTILLNLQQKRRGEQSEFSKRFFRLPEELQRMITDTLPLRDLPRVTSSIFPQEYWLALLLKGSLPWLWDLDLWSIKKKAQEPPPGGRNFEWNWELLFRQLTRGVDFGVMPDIPDGTPSGGSIKTANGQCRSPETFWGTTSYYDDFMHVPPGLFNRRRIWQLLEEMFVGDMLPKAFEGEPMGPGFDRPGPRFVVEEYIQIPWGKSGHLLPKPKWLPSLDLEPYVRKLDGKVYIKRPGRRALQYWQDPGGYWRLYSPFADDTLDETDEQHRKPPADATAEELNTVLRQLGYPV